MKKLDTEYIRRRLEKAGIVNGQVVDEKALSSAEIVKHVMAVVSGQEQNVK